MPSVYTLASQPNHWNNTQLLKECGLIPFMLHKNFGYKAVMVGENTGDYPYLELLPGLEMDFIPSSNGNIEVFVFNSVNYVNKNYQKIDILIMRGLYPTTCVFIQEYKQKRPDGKVYLYLDANKYWMDNIRWEDPLFFNTLASCDVISTSCYKMTEYLNKKWPPFIVEHIPNGFFNASGEQIIKYVKENIILTVGRIGTDQKANHILLLAFAMVANNLPNWKVHLAGPVEAKFSEFTDQYFKNFPQLKKRVKFLGNITDKKKLYAEYAKAKIFALTSVVEGGAPNVTAEALFHGCYTITSDIDAAVDITDSEKCGRIFSINDHNALYKILLKVCTNKKLLQDAPQKSTEFAKSHYDWDLIINRINHLLNNVPTDNDVGELNVLWQQTTEKLINIETSSKEELSQIIRDLSILEKLAVKLFNEIEDADLKYKLNRIKEKVLNILYSSPAPQIKRDILEITAQITLDSP
ncbi:MAG: glycosyltransferase [Fibromonadaceae bacterium]|jgi:glycosyltransferase involved in cell wall biosynthesis|nr:glycosyltransferase [Fibromonadaceae bacterium]